MVVSSNGSGGAKEHLMCVLSIKELKGKLIDLQSGYPKFGNQLTVTIAHHTNCMI